MNSDATLTASAQRDLIYDVGMHKGEDTDFYLRKGFRVVGIEADPRLAQQCRGRFAGAIQAGRLTLIEGAVVDPAAIGAPGAEVAFYANLDDSVWGTAIPSWADRNVRLGTRVTEVRVRALDFHDILVCHGIPHYMKIDIEGADAFCLQSLLHFDARPSFVSIESEKIDADRLRAELDLLERLGYAAYQAVQQERVPRQRPPMPAREGVYVEHTFAHGSSGLFGRELPGRWVGREDLSAQYRRIFRLYRCFGDDSLLRRSYLGRQLLALLRKARRRPLPGWYDTHARHGSVAD